MKKRIITIAVLVVIALIVAWRFWPRSLAKLVPDNIGEAEYYSAYTSVSGIKGTRPNIDTWLLDNIPQDEFMEIMELLETSGYRSDFRNLLPWGISYVESDKNYDGRFANIHIGFKEENENVKFVGISFFSSSQVSISGVSRLGSRIYHPTNSATLDYLVGYLQANGELQ